MNTIQLNLVYIFISVINQLSRGPVGPRRPSKVVSLPSCAVYIYFEIGFSLDFEILKLNILLIWLLKNPKKSRTALY